MILNPDVARVAVFNHKGHKDLKARSAQDVFLTGLTGFSGFGYSSAIALRYFSGAGVSTLQGLFKPGDNDSEEILMRTG